MAAGHCTSSQCRQRNPCLCSSPWTFQSPIRPLDNQRRSRWMNSSSGHRERSACGSRGSRPWSGPVSSWYSSCREVEGRGRCQPCQLGRSCNRYRRLACERSSSGLEPMRRGFPGDIGLEQIMSEKVCLQWVFYRMFTKGSVRGQDVVEGHVGRGDGK